MKALKIIIIYFLLASCVAPSSDAQTVYVTKTGTKYHLASCQYLRKTQYSISMKEAVDKGYEACSVCEPGSPSKTQEANTTVIDASSKETDTTAHIKNLPPPKRTEVKSHQCKATTKTGTRCKRMTTNASGRCYQHE